MIVRLVAAATLACVAGSAAAHPVNVRSCGREVTFDAPPSRAVSNDVNLTDMMVALGLQDRMAGFTGVSRHATGDRRMLEELGDLPELTPQYPTREVLLAAGADFYFAGWNYGMRIGGEVTPDTLEPFGIRVYELTESCTHVMPAGKATMETMYTDILNLGTIFGVRDRAEELVARYRSEVAAAGVLQEGTTPVRVFVYDSGEDQPFTSGLHGMPTALIEAAGGRNVMDDVASSWTRVAWEPVVERAPEVIVIIDYGEVTAEQKRDFLRSTPALAGMPAVRDDRFVVLDYVEATPGPRNVEAVGKLARGFHPK